MEKDKQRDRELYSIEALEAELEKELERSRKKEERRKKLPTFFSTEGLRKLKSSSINGVRKLTASVTSFPRESLKKIKFKVFKADRKWIQPSFTDINKGTAIAEEKPKQLAGKERRKFIFLIIKRTLSVMAVVAAIAVLIANLWLPVLRIYGSSMTPTVDENEIVVTAKGFGLKTGDVVGFYYNNKILIKRVIAGPGSWVNIEDNGDVYVDGEKLSEPYLQEKALGECNIDLPYQVPDKKYFMMGDHRSTSVDSRNNAVGCVSEDQIIGKIIFRVYPFEKFGFVK